MKPEKRLTDLQMAVMEVLWQQEEATAAQVHDSLQESRQLAFTTVATMLSRLDKYGLVTHRVEGRQYVYRPLLSRQQVCHRQLSTLIDRFFRGNPADLAYHLLDEGEVSPDDLERLLVLIESRKEQ